jgi:15,16-dihydrobiliverdin:ferredoxin oxidoreductase
LLGIDLLSFGQEKILCVVDFQPLSQEPEYLEKYTSQLTPIRDQFAKHCSRMRKDIYNEDMFFSKELIFYRSSKGAADPALQVT